MLKQKLLYDALAAVCLLLCLLFLLLLVFELLPQEATAVSAEEALTVSSAALNQEGTAYRSLVRGSLRNETDADITVDAVTVTVRAGAHTEDWTVETSLFLPARATANILKQYDTLEEFDRIEAVRVTVGETVSELSNGTTSSSLGLNLLLAALGALFLFLSVRFFRIRLLVGEEEKLPA